MLLERNNFIAEDGLGHVADLVEKQSREIASTERHEPPTGQLPEHARAEARYPLAAFIDNTHFAHVIAEPLDCVRQAHSLGNVVSEPPEIDDVTATPQPRSTFEQRRLEPAASQPEGKRRARNTDARDEYCLGVHGINIEPEAVRFQVGVNRVALTDARPLPVYRDCVAKLFCSGTANFLRAAEA